MIDYRGRFAPTPSGLLHFGSLFAAVVSYLDAKSFQGTWLVRIEDIDPPREQAGAASAILRTLEQHGLHWDEQETYQSHNTQRYLDALEQLQVAGHLFWCKCSRKQLAAHQVYPGTCHHQTTPQKDCAIRLAVTTNTDHYQDIFQGSQIIHLKRDYGDIVLRRRDQLFAYQLAVVCDDIAQGINHIIRGIDLMASTPWQRELYRNLNNPHPEYGHFPVIHNVHAKQKLSKQNLAPAINNETATENLQSVFHLLQLRVDNDSPKAMLNQAIDLWQRTSLQNKQILQEPKSQLD